MAAKSEQAKTNFNSIKVQLKPKQPNEVGKLYEFQFHKGTIKTHIHQVPYRLVRLFQFHKGTIKTHCFWIYNILIFNRICECKVKESY